MVTKKPKIIATEYGKLMLSKEALNNAVIREIKKRQSKTIKPPPV